MEAIILAGGLGTRLRSAVPDLPKCMAPVNGKPFLHYVIASAQQQGVASFIFSLGYKSEAIVDYIKTVYPTLNAKFSVEAEPLGTGGAIALACKLATEKNVLVLNGDTLFNVNVQALFNFHKSNGADCTLALKPMHNFNRYGVVEMNEHNRITDFKEKQYYQQGLINGGVYIINSSSLLYETFPDKFSFEKDYFEAKVNERQFFGFQQDGYFIDIGIPEDYEKAQRELK